MKKIVEKIKDWYNDPELREWSDEEVIAQAFDDLKADYDNYQRLRLALQGFDAYISQRHAALDNDCYGMLLEKWEQVRRVASL